MPIGTHHCDMKWQNVVPQCSHHKDDGSVPLCVGSLDLISMFSIFIYSSLYYAMSKYLFRFFTGAEVMLLLA